MPRKEGEPPPGFYLVLALLLYLVLALLLFAFRHPWMTDTERLLHLPDALRLRQLPREK